MTDEQRTLLSGAAMHFHQDFDLDDWTARDLFAAYSRGLEVAQRDVFYASLAALLQKYPEDQDFWKAWWDVGAHQGASRDDVQDFLVWSATQDGREEIGSPGPTVEYRVVRASLDSKTT
jgi:hypothetical protein